MVLIIIKALPFLKDKIITMKKIFFTLSLLLIISISFAQNKSNSANFYYYGNQKITFKESKSKLFLRVPENRLVEVKKMLSTSFQLDEKNITPLAEPRLFVVDIKKDDADFIKAIINEIRLWGKAEIVRPALVSKDGKNQIIDEGFYVKLNTGVSYQQLSSFALNKACTIIAQYKYDDRTYILKAGEQNHYDGLALANIFYKSGLFEYAEPDFQVLDMLNKSEFKETISTTQSRPNNSIFGKTSTPNDPYFPLQWAAVNNGSVIQFSGTVGADIDLDEAWNISKGSSTIRIAVIDEGVDRMHPDLINNISPLGFGLVSANAVTGSPISDANAHGTECAGIIAAEADNLIGISGVAPQCKIIPVNITINSDGIFGTSSQIASGIDWAWDIGGADVLSNSWGGSLPSSLKDDAIHRAVTLGRAGKGAVVVFAAGNSGAGVIYPGNHKEVITVAAMSMCYEKKSGISCDGEDWWGSSYGVGLSIAAPGVKIVTTTITGTGTGTGDEVDYDQLFNGTSAATPHVSGVAALILSINGNFTQNQVKEILERSARKVGGYYYRRVEGQPNGSWSNELGHGMLNAKNALLLAQSSNLCHIEIAKPASLQTCAGNNINLQVTNSVLGNTYNWFKDGINVGSGASFNANQTGNYNVTLNTSSGCKDTSYIIPIMVSSPDGPLVADAGRDTTINADQKVFLGGGPAGAGGTGIIHPMRGIGYSYYEDMLVRFNSSDPLRHFKVIDSSFAPLNTTYSGTAVTPYGLYMMGDSGDFVKVDTANGNTYLVGNFNVSGASCYGMTYDPVTDKIFAVYFNNSINRNYLYEVNRITGAATQIATISPATNPIYSLSADNNGDLYAMESSYDYGQSAKIHKINKATGASTLVGNLGFLAYYIQDGAIDPITNNYFLTATTDILPRGDTFEGGGIWQVDKNSGTGSLIGMVGRGGYIMDGLGFANKEYKYQWSPTAFLSNPNDANPQFSASWGGVYNYTLTVTDLCGNTTSNQVAVTVLGPTPVTLLNFNGRIQNSITHLNWDVENEINFDRYEVERSVDGRAFVTLGNVHAIGSSSVTQRYHFEDYKLPAETYIFYRLKMIDIDGTYSYSQIIKLKRDRSAEDGLITITPNPFSDKIVLLYESTQPDKVRVSITDSKGSLIKQKMFLVEEGINQLYVNGANLPTGLYFVTVKDRSKKVTRKVIKQ